MSRQLDDCFVRAQADRLAKAHPWIVDHEYELVLGDLADCVRALGIELTRAVVGRLRAQRSLTPANIGHRFVRTALRQLRRHRASAPAVRCQTDTTRARRDNN